MNITHSSACCFCTMPVGFTSPTRKTDILGCPEHDIRIDSMLEALN
jgi:hypothetical protein